MTHQGASDEKAKLYAQECEALKSLCIEDKFPWPERWPRKGQQLQKTKRRPESMVLEAETSFPDQKHAWVYTDYAEGGRSHTLKNLLCPAPCGETVLMLMEWLGEDLRRVDQYGSPSYRWRVKHSKIGKPILNSCGKTLTLALCTAVRAKMKAKEP